jgi:hypothetical protein
MTQPPEPEYVEIDVGDEDISIRDMPTLIRCPSCEHCHGCDGRTMVTKERAAEIRAAIKAQGGPHR